MSGIVFIKKLREIDANIKVILMTAFEMEGSQLKEIDTDEFFNKPIGMNNIQILLLVFQRFHHHFP